MIRLNSRLFLLLSLSLIFPFFSGCGKKSAPGAAPKTDEKSATPDRISLTPEQRDNAKLTLFTVKHEVPVREIPLTGSVAYDDTRTARVAPRISGRIVKLVADLGQRVKKGDVLCVLDSVEQGEAQAEYLAKLADYRLAREALERAKKLIEREAISQGEYLEREASFRKAKAALGFSENRLHLFDMTDADVRRLNGSLEAGGPADRAGSPNLNLRSPLAGSVVRRDASTGQGVERLQTLYVISDLRQVWAWLDVYEKDLSQVGVGNRVLLKADSFPDMEFLGRVDFIGEVESASRTSRVRVGIANPKELLRPGMFVRATLKAAESGLPALLIPKEAVQVIDGKPMVFRQLPEGAFATSEVKVGRAFGGLVEILTGLHDNDIIVSSGAFALKGEAMKAHIGGEE